jgi:hypothetical protein
MSCSDDWPVANLDAKSESVRKKNAATMAILIIQNRWFRTDGSELRIPAHRRKARREELLCPDG